MGKNKILETKNLSLSWDSEAVVEDINLDLYEGEIVCLLGKSGCGKTTLFHALAGLTEPDFGEILLEGRPLEAKSGDISYMLQKDLLIPSRTILDNVCLPLILKGMKKEDAYKKAMPYFERFGIENTQSKWPCQLSGGMRQRAALLRTYMMDNKVVLLDEPFSALDALTRSELRVWFISVIKDLSSSALLITHDVDEAVLLADRIYVMKGNPASGVTSTITGCIEIQREEGYEGFDLTSEFLEYKKQVLKSLN